MRRSEFKLAYALLAGLACFAFHPHAVAAEPGPSIIPQLQERLGLSEAQVRGSLGALLIFVRERLPKPEFDRVVEEHSECRPHHARDAPERNREWAAR